MKNKPDAILTEARQADISLILDAMERLNKEFPSHFFVPSTPEELSYVIRDKKGFVLLLFIEEMLAGGIIVMYPDEKIHYLSNHDYQKCAIIDSIFLDPKFRGQGVASRLMKGALARLNSIPFVYASVALDNHPSQKLFFRHDFKIYEQKKLYNDYDRYVLLLERASPHVI